MKKILVTILTLFSTTAFANDAQQRLEKFLTDLNTMEATLIQTVMDARKDIIDESEGHIWVARPEKF